MERIKLQDLYFGICVEDFNSKKLKPMNLFGSARVLRSVATWVMMSPSERNNIADPLHFCFGDTDGRVEYEMGVVHPTRSMAEVELKDVYEMYVAPNADYLMSLVERVSPSSAKKHLAEWRKGMKCQ